MQTVAVVQGYLPLAHEFERGGYEVEIRSTYFEPGTADALLSILLGWVGGGGGDSQTAAGQQQEAAAEQIPARL
jgi:hypothetical protein